MTRDEAITLAGALAQQVRRHRKARDWSQEKLASELANLGVVIQPTAITRIEKEDRKVSIEELFALAQAFGVPPAFLLFPVGHVSTVSVGRGSVVSTWDALNWWMGTKPYPGQSVEDFELARGAFDIYRDHDAQADFLAEQEEPRRCKVEVDQLRMTRTYMRRIGVALPTLPDRLKFIDGDEED